MIITETGILVSTDPNMRDPVPLNFKIEGGQVGDNSVRATGLTADTTYYAQSYFVKDGIYVRQKGVTEFKTAAQEEVLKIKNAYAGNNNIAIMSYGDVTPITLSYSTDQGTTWNTWTKGVSDFNTWWLSENGELWLKGNNQRISSSSTAYYYFLTGQIADCEGSISSLVRKDLQVIPDYCFYKLFQNTKIRTAPALMNSILLGQYCYGLMFYGCTSLTQAPVLPATELAPYCYAEMFENCSALTTPPALPATTLATECYRLMFYGCTALASSPSLPATTMQYRCYYGMFYGCTSLTAAPALPATGTLPSGCYSNMFRGCTSLTSAPALPATTLSYQSYSNMFNGCTALTQAPELPATYLDQESYISMFYGCTALTQAPSELPSARSSSDTYSYMFYGCTSLTTAPVVYGFGYGSAKSMFYGCTSLNKIICYASSWNTNTTYNWVQNVAASGDFYNLGGANIPIDNRSGVPIGWTLHTSLHDPLTITNGESGQNTITLTKTGSPQDITLEYSTDDGSTWTSWSSANGNLSVTIEDGESVMLRGNNSTFSNGDIRYDTDYYNFGSTGEFSLSGDIMSLLADNVVAVPSWCFFFAFYNSKVTTVSSGLLSSEQLSMGCYYGMFRGCSLLTQAPALHSTQLAAHCYSNMFRSCSSLTQAPALPATTLASSCYQSMFAWCTSLTQAPELPATQIAGTCYANMLEHTAITRAPELPATQLTTMCYYMMFYGCSSLTQAPELPATTLAGSCYQDMFYGCTSVDRIVTYASDISAPSCISLWLGNVSATGDFYNLGGATYPSGDNGIPTGWTEHTSL